MARHNIVGETGEDVAAEFLVAKGWTILDRNFRRPYGEIDIVARETSGLLVFVEVKTVSHETANPAENMHSRKLRRLGNVIQVYLESKRHACEWRLDLVGVFLDHYTKQAKISHMENIVIGT